MSSNVIYYLVMHFLAQTQHHRNLGWARRLFFIELSKVIHCYENVLKYFALQAWINILQKIMAAD